MVDISHAAESIEFILRHVYGIDVAKALDPLDPKDFAVISDRFQTAVKTAVAGEEAAAVKLALDRLDVNWVALNSAQMDAVIVSARQAIAGTSGKVIPKLEPIFANRGRAVHRATKASVGTTYELNIKTGLSAIDARILEHAVSSQALYITDEYGRRAVAMSNTARDIVEEGLRAGHGREVIARNMEAALTAQSARRSKAYYDMAAGTFMNRSRTYASLVAYQETDIQHYIFDAILDEATSVQCRYLHGRSFSVEVAVTKYKEVAERPPQEVKQIQPWMRTARYPNGQQYLYFNEGEHRTVVADVNRSGVGNVDDRGEFNQRLSDLELMGKGVAVPPLHGSCRSRLIPDFA